jgi:hypothetical protein
MEYVGNFYDHFVYFTAKWSILGTFGTFLVIWYNFSRFGMLQREKSGNPAVISVCACKFRLEVQHRERGKARHLC